MNVKRKGSEKERDLANFFWERGCAVLRGCSSGGGIRKRYVPDIVVICKGVVLVFEVKYRSKYSPVFIDGEKIEKLLNFTKRAGGRALLLVKYGRDSWRVLEVMPRVGREEYERGIELGAYIQSILSKNLDHYF